LLYEFAYFVSSCYFLYLFFINSRFLSPNNPNLKKKEKKAVATFVLSMLKFFVSGFC